MDNTIEKANKLIQDIQEDFIKTAPMWIRISSLRNMVYSVLQDGYVEADIDWKKINDFLMGETDEYDFNIVKEVHNYAELDELHSIIVEATVLHLSWQKHKCRDCGNDFTLKYSEVMFYKNKELHIPKRCKACRDKRRNNK